MPIIAAFLTFPLKSPAQISADSKTLSIPEAQFNAEDLVVKNITVNGNEIISTADILRQVSIASGDKYDREKIIRSLQAINSMGYFDNRALRVDPKPIGDNGVDLVFQVHENPTVSEVKCSGNKIIESSVILKSLLNLKGRPENWNLVTDVINDVENQYHSRDFTLASVSMREPSIPGVIELLVIEGIIDQIKILKPPGKLVASAKDGQRKLRFKLDGLDGNPLVVDTTNGLPRNTPNDPLKIQDKNQQNGESEALAFVTKQTARLKGTAYNSKTLKTLLQQLVLFDQIAKIEHFVAPSDSSPEKYTLTIVVTEEPSSLPAYVSSH